MSPRVLLVGDHPTVRQALRRFLEWEGLEVVGDACDGAEVLRLAWERRAEVVILDCSRPLANCFDLAREIVRTLPVKGVILVTFEDYLVARALQAGIRGYVLKARVVEELPSAIRQVAHDAIYLSPGIAPAIVKTCLTAANRGPGVV